MIYSQQLSTVQYCTIKYSHHVVHYHESTFIYIYLLLRIYFSYNWIFLSFDLYHSISASPRPWQSLLPSFSMKAALKKEKKKKDFTYKWYVQCFSFSVWLVSLSIVTSIFIYVVANGKIFFFWPDNIPLYIYTPIFPFHLSVERYFSCFHILPMIDNVSINVGVQTSPWDTDFNSSRYIFKSGIAGPEKILSNNQWLLFLMLASMDAQCLWPFIH